MSTRIYDGSWRAAIDYVREFAPRLAPWVDRADYVAGVDPVFTGLIKHESTFDGRSYRDVACCVYQSAKRRDLRRPTIVLPSNMIDEDRPWIIVHELAHAVHDYFALDGPQLTPFDDYAATSYCEVFAAAFEGAIHRERVIAYDETLERPTRDDVRRHDGDGALSFFDRLIDRHSFEGGHLL